MNLFDKVENVLSLMPHGWCSVRKGQTLAALVLALRPRLVVEIGVYGGRSFLPLILALHHACEESGQAGSRNPQRPLAVAVGIDPYDAAVSAAGEVAANADWWGRLDHGAIKRGLYEFLEAVPEFRSHWEMVERRSDEVNPHALVLEHKCNIDLLHVDGAHTEQAIRDVKRFAEWVRIGGFVVLDDLLWEGGAVSASVNELDRMGFVERFRVIGAEERTGFEDNWGVYQRVALRG